MIYNPCPSPVTASLSILAAIGAINWGLIGAFDFNLVTYLLGTGSTMTKIVYAGVGVGGLYSLFATVKSLSGSSTVDAK